MGFTLARFFPHINIFQSDSFHLILLVTAMAGVYRPMDRAALFLTRYFLMHYGRDYTREIELLGQHIDGRLNLAEMGNTVVNTICDALLVPSALFLIKDRTHARYSVLSSCGLRIGEMSKISFGENELLIRLATEEAGPLLRDELIMHLSWQEANVAVEEFQRLRSALVIPFFHQGELVALCALSLRAKGKPYLKEHLKLFGELATRMGPLFGQAIQMHELSVMNHQLKDQQATLLQASKLSAIEQLASGFAHQIHNPLTIISGKAQVLLLRKEKHQLSEEAVKVLQSIVKETRRAADITQKLVAFSKLKKPIREPIDFKQVVEDTLSLVSYRASLDAINVVCHIQDDLPVFQATVSECREMFLNLFLNAIDAMNGGGALMIRIKCPAASTEIEIKVSDSGKGIAKADLPNLFDPFFSTRHERAGLGLFVVQKIVHRYGGTIRVDSEEGRGTVFTIRFPASVAAESQEMSRHDSPKTKTEPAHTLEEVTDYAQDSGR